MADIVFNVSKGRLAYYASLPATNDALKLVPIETSGIVSDATMRDYTTLDAILAGASNEQTTIGRKTLASVSVTVDQSNDRVDLDAADVTYTAATGNAISAVVVVYDPDTTSPVDANMIPLVKLDCVATPDGSDLLIQFNAAGFARAS